MDAASFLELVKTRKMEKYVKYLVGIVRFNFNNPQEVVLFKNRRHGNRHEEEFHSDEEIEVVVECLILGGIERIKIKVLDHTVDGIHEETDKDNYWVVSDWHYKIRAPFCRSKNLLIQFPTNFLFSIA